MCDDYAKAVSDIVLVLMVASYVIGCGSGYFMRAFHEQVVKPQNGKVKKLWMF